MVPVPPLRRSSEALAIWVKGRFSVTVSAAPMRMATRRLVMV